MKKINNIFTLLVTALVGLSLTACSSDDLDTNQYQSGVSLNAFGPSPVMRGGQLRFIGSNLDQIREVRIPGVDAITAIEVVKAGVPSEIRVSVPHDGPEPGHVVLVANNDKEITTVSTLTYIEGITIERVTSSAMPGEVIEIVGDYLNLVHSMAFADNVIVSENDFIQHDRYTIKVRVPEEAKTGKLQLFTADLTVGDASKLDYQIVTTEDRFIVGTPTVAKVKGREEVDAEGSFTAKVGETITVNGSYLQLVKAVTVGDYTIEDIIVSENGASLSFVLPAEAPDGAVNLVCKSEVIVPAAVLTTVKPSSCTVNPNPVKAGIELTVSGTDMDVVSAVEFDNAGSLTGDAIAVSADKVVVKAVPETATEGTLYLVMANGAKVSVPFTLVKPVVTGYDNANVSAGGALTIVGTNLDLVKKVQFGEGTTEVTVDATATSISLTVPMDAKSGAPTLVLANGTTVDNVPEVNIMEAQFCYVTEFPDDDHTPSAGSIATLPVKNGEKLTAAYIDGTQVNFVYDTKNSTISVAIPQKSKKNTVLRLVSDGFGEITYTMTVIPATDVDIVLWSGLVDLGKWSINYEVKPADMFVNAGVQAGWKLRIYGKNTADFWQIQLYDGHWGGMQIPGWADDGVSTSNNMRSDKQSTFAENGYIEIELTQDLVNLLTTNIDWGYSMIIQGENFMVNKITLHYTQSFEQTVWSDRVDLGSWSVNYEVKPNDIFAAAGVTKGSVVRFYGEATASSWQFQLFDGHWGGMPVPGWGDDGVSTSNNMSSAKQSTFAEKGYIEIELNEDIATRLTTLTDWGYCCIIQGENFVLTKITVE